MLDHGQILKIGDRAEFEAIRDGNPSGDLTNDLIRQFLRGDPDGPLAERREESEYEQAILEAAEGRGTHLS
jgi:hypothetical protein